MEEIKIITIFEHLVNEKPNIVFSVWVDIMQNFLLNNIVSAAEKKYLGELMNIKLNFDIAEIEDIAQNLISWRTMNKKINLSFLFDAMAILQKKVNLTDTNLFQLKLAETLLNKTFSSEYEQILQAKNAELQKETRAEKVKAAIERSMTKYANVYKALA
jgi:hypothetical protein